LKKGAKSLPHQPYGVLRFSESVCSYLIGFSLLPYNFGFSEKKKDKKTLAKSLFTKRFREARILVPVFTCLQKFR